MTLKDLLDVINASSMIIIETVNGYGERAKPLAFDGLVELEEYDSKTDITRYQVASVSAASEGTLFIRLWEN